MGGEPVGFEDSDPIAPTRIQHQVDDIIIDGRLEQTYNFIDYDFETAAGPITARTYLDRVHLVSIFPGLDDGRGAGLSLDQVWAPLAAHPSALEDVVRFFARRFLVITAPGLYGDEDVIWMDTHARRVLEPRGSWPP